MFVLRVKSSRLSSSCCNCTSKVNKTVVMLTASLCNTVLSLVDSGRVAAVPPRPLTKRLSSLQASWYSVSRCYNVGVGSWQNTSDIDYLQGNICNLSPPFLRLCLGVCNYCPGPISLPLWFDPVNWVISSLVKLSIVKLCYVELSHMCLWVNWAQERIGKTTRLIDTLKIVKRLRKVPRFLPDGIRHQTKG